MNGSKSWDEFMERPRMKRLTQAREAAHEHVKDLPLYASRTNRRESYVAGWLDADDNPAPLTDEKRALTCHCGRITGLVHEEPA